jgi:hypothetical protein
LPCPAQQSNFEGAGTSDVHLIALRVDSQGHNEPEQKLGTMRVTHGRKLESVYGVQRRRELGRSPECCGLVRGNVAANRTAGTNDAPALRPVGSRTQTVEGDAARRGPSGRSVLEVRQISAHSWSGSRRGHVFSAIIEQQLRSQCAKAQCGRSVGATRRYLERPRLVVTIVFLGTDGESNCHTSNPYAAASFSSVHSCTLGLLPASTV